MPTHHTHHTHHTHTHTHTHTHAHSCQRKAPQRSNVVSNFVWCSRLPEKRGTLKTEKNKTNNSPKKMMILPQRQAYVWMHRIVLQPCVHYNCMLPTWNRLTITTLLLKSLFWCWSYVFVSSFRVITNSLDYYDSRITGKIPNPFFFLKH